MNVMCLPLYHGAAAGDSGGVARVSALYRQPIFISVANFSARETEEQVGARLTARAGRCPPPVGGDFMAAGTISALQAWPAGAAGCLGDEH